MARITIKICPPTSPFAPVIGGSLFLHSAPLRPLFRRNVEIEFLIERGDEIGFLVVLGPTVGRTGWRPRPRSTRASGSSSPRRSTPVFRFQDFPSHADSSRVSGLTRGDPSPVRHLQG